MSANTNRSILQISQVSPVPVVGGRQLRSWNLLDALRKEISVHLLAGWRTTEERESLESLASAPGLTVESFQLYPGVKSKKEQLLRPIRHRRLPELARRVQKLTGKFSLVRFDTLASAAYRDDVNPGVPCWLDQQNVESGILHRRAQCERGLNQMKFKLAANTLAWEEQRMVRSMDLITAVSVADAEVFAAWRRKRDGVVIVPNGVNVPDVIKPSKYSGHLMFLGPLGYPPNWEGVCWFLENVWLGILKQRPGAIFHVVGRASEKQFELLRNYQNVHAHGYVENLTDAYALANIVVVPLLNGGGTKLKVLEAMAHQKAVVGTKIAFEGLNLTHNLDCLVSEKTSDLLKNILVLLEKPELSTQIGLNSRRIVKEKYAWEKCAKLQSEAFKHILKR